MPAKRAVLYYFQTTDHRWESDRPRHTHVLNDLRIRPDLKERLAAVEAATGFRKHALPGGEDADG